MTSAPITIDSWKLQRTELRNAWMKILGPFPERCPLDLQVISTTEEPDHLRQLIRYQVEPGIYTDAFVLRPKAVKGQAPAAVVFHATSSNHILQPVGLADANTRHLALHLVRRGYITITPRCFIYGTADTTATTRPATPARSTNNYTSASRELLARRPGWTGMGKMLWDGMRAVDVLESLPGVDSRRIICVGHSLGAKEALYLAAFDERIVGAIASEGGVGLKQSNWESTWYLGERIPDATVRDHDQLLKLTAPRMMMIVGGESADGTRTLPLVERARPVYALYGKPEALVLQLHAAGHDIPETEREQAFDVLDRLLVR